MEIVAEGVWGTIVGWGVAYGLLLSAGFTVVLLAGALVAPDFGVHNYPPAVRDRYGAKSRRGRQVTAVAGGLIAVLVVGVITAGLLQVRSVTGELAWQPKLVVLPGTEGMPEYRDLRFHFDGFVKGLGICTVVALLAAVAATSWRPLPDDRQG